MATQEVLHAIEIWPLIKEVAYVAFTYFLMPAVGLYVAYINNKVKKEQEYKKAMDIKVSEVESKTLEIEKKVNEIELTTPIILAQIQLSLEEIKKGNERSGTLLENVRLDMASYNTRLRNLENNNGKRSP